MDELFHLADALSKVASLIAAWSPHRNVNFRTSVRESGGDQKLVSSIAVNAVVDGAWSAHSSKRSNMGCPVVALGLGKPRSADRVGAMSRMAVRR